MSLQSNLALTYGKRRKHRALFPPPKTKLYPVQTTHTKILRDGTEHSETVTLNAIRGKRGGRMVYLLDKMGRLIPDNYYTPEDVAGVIGSIFMDVFSSRLSTPNRIIAFERLHTFVKHMTPAILIEMSRARETVQGLIRDQQGIIVEGVRYFCTVDGRIERRLP